ncbi:MAG TPA: biotin/lipoyl-containing protein [Streptosporangiaceae bacterium]|nr:biotin/lipoyl-containing protein [Streptosporangiaceae bacterium]
MNRHTPDAPEPDVPTDTDVADTNPGQVAEVLEQVRGEAIRLLDEVPQPQALRVQAGGVRVEVEWATAGQPVQPVRPARDEPTTGLTTGPAARFPESSESAATAEQAAEPGLAHVTSPAVGVFYRAPEPGADPFVAEGDAVSAGQQVAIVEAMKLMIPVEADQPGRIAKVLKEDGEPVEYEERLFALDLEGAA